jgi:hypothetical protein
MSLSSAAAMPETPSMTGPAGVRACVRMRRPQPAFRAKETQDA